MTTHPSKSIRVALCVFITSALLLNHLIAWMAGAVWTNAPGVDVLKKGGTTIDISNTQDGYIMLKHKEAKKRLKVSIAEGKETFTYDLNGDGEYEVFPLQPGTGKYKVSVFKQAKGTKYSQESQQSFSVDRMNDNAPFLCANQYVWYTEKNNVVAVSEEICAGLSTDEEKFNAVVEHLKSTMQYHFERAATVEVGYLPNIDDAYADGKGICFDLSAIMACMLRVQGIPTKLVIGYAGKYYHAWTQVLIDGEYRLCDITADVMGTPYVSKYTTERVY